MTRVLPWLVAMAVCGWLILLWLFDPEGGQMHLPCPFHWLTGWHCPGCGSQRALHDLLHGRIAEAFGHNAAMILAVPALMAQWGIGRWRGRPLDTDNRVVYAWGIALLGWGVVRNLPGMEVLAP